MTTVPKKRETAAERRARQLAEQAERQAAEWSEFTANYTVRFANLLFNYMNQYYANFRVSKVDDETFSFSRTDYRFSELELKVIPPTNFSWEYKNEFEQAEELLADYAAEQVEKVRKSEVRLNALNKLTAEERELLNL